MNKIKDAFSQVKASSDMKDQTLEFINIKINAKRHYHYKKTAVALICSAIILCSGAFSITAVAAPISYVSVDTDSSIELKLNRYNKVVSAAAFDKNGEEILDNISVKWQDCSEAVNQITDCAKKLQITDSGTTVDITVSSKNKNAVKNIENKLNDNTNTECHSTDKALVDEAKQHNISFGKYKAYLILNKYDKTFTIEDAKNMSMREIKEKISQYTDDTEYCGGTSKGQNSQNGKGNQNQHKNTNGNRVANKTQYR